MALVTRFLRLKNRPVDGFAEEYDLPAEPAPFPTLIRIINNSRSCPGRIVGNTRARHEGMDINAEGITIARIVGVPSLSYDKEFLMKNPSVAVFLFFSSGNQHRRRSVLSLESPLSPQAKRVRETLKTVWVSLVCSRLRASYLR